MVSACREQLLSSSKLFVIDSIFVEQTIFFERKWSVRTEALDGGERGRVALADDLLIYIIYINIYKYIIYYIIYLNIYKYIIYYIIYINIYNYIIYIIYINIYKYIIYIIYINILDIILYIYI